MDHFGVLGPLTISLDGAPVRLPAAMQRRLLAVLLCRSPRPVSVADALEALWGATPPPSARKTLQVYVHRLRHVLGTHRVFSGPGGYQLTVGTGECDALRFADLFERGCDAHRSARLDEAGELLAEALGLWRGAAYADVADCPLVAEEIDRLTELRVLAHERLAAVDLERDRYAEAVRRLGELTTTQPYREHLHGQLMTALYRSGRQADALDTYRRFRQRLADELGIEPVPELQRLHESILRGEVLTSPRPIPRELPRDVSAFTGREAALRRLDAALAAGVVVISGMAGVGKTSLAVHWAHRVAPGYPDGQLYVDLRGYAPDAAATPGQAIAQLLRALGMAADEVPVETDEAVRRYRSLVADRRLLVVLDNAYDAGQVRPLLPTGPACLAVVTSRGRLTGLVAREGAHRVELDVLPTEESTALLDRLLREYGIAAAPGEIADLAVACGHLPLALRIAAANVAERNDIVGYVDALSDDALAGLEVPGDPEASVRATLDLSYRALAPAARALFRYLGLVPGPDLTPEAAAALVDGPADESRRRLDDLVTAHLVLRPRPGRYRLHDLLRQYARDAGLDEDTGTERAAATARLYDHYLSTVDVAAQVLYPTAVRIPAKPATGVASFAHEAAALAWLDEELANLVAVTRHAADAGHPVAWLLADVLRTYFWIRRHYGEWLATGEAGLAAARTAGDREGAAAAHLSLALAHRCLADFPGVIEHGTEALALARDAGWVEGEASALSHLAVAHAETGRTRAAFEHLVDAYGIAERLADPIARGRMLINMCTLRYHMGDLRGLLRDAEELLAIHANGHSPAAAARAHCAVGCAYLYSGRYDRAGRHLSLGLDLAERAGESYGQAVAHRMLAKLYVDTGDLDAAHRHATNGVTHGRAAKDASVEAAVLTDTAALLARLGRHDEALRDATASLDLARSAHSCHAEVEALVALADVHRLAGRLDPAADAARQAASLAEQREYRLLHADALAVMAGCGGPDGAPTARAALTMYREIGYRAGAARAEALLNNSGQTT